MRPPGFPLAPCVCERERLGESAAWNQMEFSQNQTDLQTIEIKSLFMKIPLCVRNKHYLPHDSLGGEVTEPKWILSNNWIINSKSPLNPGLQSTTYIYIFATKSHIEHLWRAICGPGPPKPIMQQKGERVPRELRSRWHQNALLIL